MRFQPTLPMRGATRALRTPNVSLSFQPTLPMRGATATTGASTRRTAISTHAPHAGSDSVRADVQTGHHLFQPTLPMRGATALCAALVSVLWQFQPTLPMRGATAHRTACSHCELFQPTLPMRGATNSMAELLDDYIISTHAPHAGSDSSLSSTAPCSTYFNPRSPCGERRPRAKRRSSRWYFNPRSPCGERPLYFVANSTI